VILASKSPRIKALKWFGSPTIIPTRRHHILCLYHQYRKCKGKCWPFGDKLVSLAYSQKSLAHEERQLWIRQFSTYVSMKWWVQRDTKRSTLEEICEKIEAVGRELTSESLSVTGHSLGGDLTTVAGFFLASNPTLQLASAIRVYTFASSPVGCNTFQHAYKYLEETGRLQHARFTNLN
jgi:hypothetical protein